MQPALAPSSKDFRNYASLRAFVIQIAARALIIAVVATSATAAENADVFAAPSSAYSSLIAEGDVTSGNDLRVIQVEERSGRSRRGDLVRVPLFFAEQECPRLDDLAIIPAEAGPEGAAVPWQADDIRRGPDGEISRVHLWFAIDLEAHQSRRFRLVRRAADASPPPKEAAVAIDATEREIRVTTENGTVIWTHEGALKALPGDGSAPTFDDAGGYPRARIKLPGAAGQLAAEIVLDRTTPGREVTWSSGPLFAKIRVRIPGPDGLSLEQVYQVPRHGREVVISAALYPGERAGSVVRENRLLHGTLVNPSPAKATVERAPAGIRHALRAEHAYTVAALKLPAGSGALLAIPLVIGGPNGTWDVGENNRVGLNGQRNLQRGGEGEKDTLYGYWTQVRLVSVEDADRDTLWKTYRRHVQPLVAVVEEPGATVDRLHDALAKIVREMKPVGWRQEAGRAWVLGDRERAAKILQNSPSPRELDRENLIRGARSSRAKLTNNGQRKLPEHEKGRAYGMLDPYHITYTQSAAAAFAVLGDAPPSVSAVNLAMASGVRQEGGRVDDAGSPYIDCFNRALNMQVGPVLFGLTAGASAGDTELVRFYRDLAMAPPVQGVFGRAQRPYSGAPAKSADQTDYLYQAICDFWFRTTELLGDEDLALHPLAYARYTDCIDVMADLYHGVAARDKPGAAGQARANFFRGQAHTHRWLGWSAAPYVRLLEVTPGREMAGLTEAIHYSASLAGRWKNWPDLTYYILTDMLVREGLERHQRPGRPAAPGAPKVQRKGGGVELTWRAVPGAAEYRVYRADSGGGPYHWLNSRYVDAPAAPLTTTHYHDESGGEGASYVISAVDSSGRESAWAEEP